MDLTSVKRSTQHVLSLLFRPVMDALWYGRHLSWNLKWRLLAFEPMHVVSSAMISLLYLYRRPFQVEYIPVRCGRDLRVLVFRPPPHRLRAAQGERLHPLHVDCHAGGFIGGYPESSATWCELVARQSGAVVVALSYRLAPVHAFPSAQDDVDDAIAWLIANAATQYGADPKMLTVSGASAGGTLALSATQALACHPPADTAIKAAVTFYSPVDLRLAPWEKPKPDGVGFDPLAFLMPLFDSYAAASRPSLNHDPRLHPGLASLATLPRRMLLVVPRIDILPLEIRAFTERVHQDMSEKREKDRKVELLWLDDLFHGFLEVPDTVVPKTKKMMVMERALQEIREAQNDCGWKWPIDSH